MRLTSSLGAKSGHPEVTLGCNAQVAQVTEISLTEC
jgi:hypothetical protein